MKASVKNKSLYQQKKGALAPFFITQKWVFFVLFLYVVAFNASAQTYFGFQAGGVTSQVTGDGYKGFKKFGLELGLSAIKPLKKEGRFWGMELNYIQKGALERQKISEGNYNTFKIRADYLELPIFYLFPLWGIYVQTGVSLSKSLITEISTNDLISPPLANQNFFELGFLGAILLEINSKMNFSVRFYNSLIPMQNGNVSTAAFYWFSQGGMHSLIGLRLQYFIQPPSFQWVTKNKTQIQSKSPSE